MNHEYTMDLRNSIEQEQERMEKIAATQRLLTFCSYEQALARVRAQTPRYGSRTATKRPIEQP